MKKSATWFVLVAGLLGGCGTVPSAGEAIFDTPSAVQSRTQQERGYDAADRRRTLRAMMETLHELGFTVDRADVDFGVITATKFGKTIVRATVTARPVGSARMRVRINAEYFTPGETGGAHALADPSGYQNFFATLAKKLTLEPRLTTSEWLPLPPRAQPAANAATP